MAGLGQAVIANHVTRERPNGETKQSAAKMRLPRRRTAVHRNDIWKVVSYVLGHPWKITKITKIPQNTK
jgi:hypothetical protein